MDENTQSADHLLSRAFIINNRGRQTVVIAAHSEYKIWAVPMEYTIKTYSRLPDRQQWRKDREYVGSANGRTQGTESGVWEF